MNDDGVFGWGDINLLCASDVQIPQVGLEILVCCLQVEKCLQADSTDAYKVQTVDGPYLAWNMRKL